MGYGNFEGETKCIIHMEEYTLEFTIDYVQCKMGGWKWEVGEILKGHLGRKYPSCLGGIAKDSQSYIDTREAVNWEAERG